jgi:RelA/SpoT family (p)ppGpp synthetase
MIEASAILKGPAPKVEPEFQRQLDELIGLCRTNLRSVDEELIRRAFYLSYWAHRNDSRASGERYIIHPLAVAKIFVEQIGFDDIGVAAALLHDVVEDTEISLEFLNESFGPVLTNIIDGLTKISGAFESRDIGQAENVRKLMLSMATDIRVIFVKFADRMHNMRTLDSLPRKKRMKIAAETLELFAPLAHRFGFYALKSEYEDLSLKILNPSEYAHISKGLLEGRKLRDEYVNLFIGPIRDRLKEDGFDFEIYGRSKNTYSIYRKMQRQNKPLQEIYDIFAIRIVLKRNGQKGKEDCWRVYSIITDLYNPIPERFRDFLSVPKSNGYQSLHTTVVGPEGNPVEVQIRTEEMHEIAEQGVAAHWKYKENVATSDAEMDRFLDWVRELLDNPDPEHAADFVQDFRLNLYDEEIYVFTPKGDLFTLPKNATPVDFAFLVHTEVGYHCIGAKVNAKMVPLSHKLRSGDQIEIITSRKQVPNPDWVKFVVTQKARSRIRHAIKEKRRDTTILGRQLWDKKAKRQSLQLDDQMLTRIASKLKFPGTEQMFFEIGSGFFDVGDLASAAKAEVSNQDAEQDQPEKELLMFDKFLDTAQSAGGSALLIDGEYQANIMTQYAPCCNPIPGDDVFGYVSRAGGIKIHRVNCLNAPDLILNHAARVVNVDWSRQKNLQFIAAIRIMGEDRVGLVSDITAIISKSLKTNISSLQVETEDGIFTATVVLSVNDVSHLKRLMQRIKRIQGIHGVYRYEENRGAEPFA